MKKAMEYFGFVFVTLVMLVAVLTYLAPHLGWRVDTVGAGSLEPRLKTGALVVTRPIDPDRIAVGDIITFAPASGNTVITHRVIDIDRGSFLYFITGGDTGGRTPSFSVPAGNVTGKICLQLPYLGYVTSFLKTPWGFLVGMVVPALFVITAYVRSILKIVRKDKEKVNKEELAEE